MKPPPRTPVARRAAATTSFTPTPKRCSAAGWICTSIDFASRPKIATLATPGTASKRGRIVQVAAVRRSISEARFEVSPATSTMLVDDVSGVIVGGITPAGSWAATSFNRSPSNWRSRYTSLDASKVAVITDRLCTEVERSVSSPGMPLIAFSSGWVTSTSTWSGASPGASVRTCTCGGANSGKTSYFAPSSV